MMAAYSLQRSNHWLGQYFRRIKSRSGPQIAIKATARKLAIIFYEMIKNKVEFNPIPLKEYEDNYKSLKIKRLTVQASQLGFKLVSTGTVS